MHCFYETIGRTSDVMFRRNIASIARGFNPWYIGIYAFHWKRKNYREVIPPEILQIYQSRALQIVEFLFTKASEKMPLFVKKYIFANQKLIN